MANTLTDDHAALRRSLAGDHHRPAYHFLPPANWINDPNGLIHWRGEYHLFYQHNPFAPVWGHMHWGHAVSRDLVHWEDRPPALATDQPYDASGCFSGCAVATDAGFTLVYTGVHPHADGSRRQVQCLAETTDGVHFAKHPANPVLADPPADMTPWHFRDPFVWWGDLGDGPAWQMALCGATPDDPHRGAVLWYRSDDLVDWAYRGPLLLEHAGSGKRTHECPNFFRLGDRWMLITSPQPTGQAWVWHGTLDGGTFDHDGGAVLDRGGCLYAPLTFLDAAGRRLLIGWVREQRSVEEAEAGGWNGCLSLPRTLTLGADGWLRQTPVAELEALRGGAFRDDVAPRGRLLEIEVRFDRDAAGGDPCGLDVLASAEPGSGLPIRVEPGSGAITAGEFTLGTLAADEHEARLRVFIDGSVIEVFANERIAGAVRHYSGSAAEDRVHLVGEPTALRAWPLRPIWPVA